MPPAKRKVETWMSLHIQSSEASPQTKLKLFVSPTKALGGAADTDNIGFWNSPKERAAGPKGWRLFQKAEDAEQIVEKITKHVLEEQVKDQKIVDAKENYITGKAPVRLAAKMLIVAGLGENEPGQGHYNRMRVLASKDPAAAASLMNCLAPAINAATVTAKAVKFDQIAKRRNLLAHPADIEELDEAVEAADLALSKSDKLRTDLSNECKLISNHQASRPYLKSVGTLHP